MADSDGPWAQLGRWSPTLWLIAGAVGIVYAALYGVEAVTGSYPSIRGYLGPVMNVAAFTALLGLAHAFSARQPRLARVGGVCAALAIVGSVIAVAATAGIVSQEATWVGASQLLLIVVGMTLAFLAVGAASLRSDSRSWTVGVLLLVPAAIMGLNIGIVIADFASPEGRLLVSGLWALTYLALGLRLRRGTASGASSRSMPDATR